LYELIVNTNNGTYVLIFNAYNGTYNMYVLKHIHIICMCFNTYILMYVSKYIHIICMHFNTYILIYIFRMRYALFKTKKPTFIKYKNMYIKMQKIRSWCFN
jgi:hypothetical protein